MKLLILSDIHGNISALRTVLKYTDSMKTDFLVLLGDLIDYCPHSNEVIEAVSQIHLPVLCNIRGNHEDAILNERYENFSSPRGVQSAKYTRSILSEKSFIYLSSKMEKSGKKEFCAGGKKILAVHGTLKNEYWGKFNCAEDLSEYSDFDVVLMGHSHRPIFYEAFFKSENSETRNQKKTIFINPGSVGQPRNLCPDAQFAIFDTSTEECNLIKIPYDIKNEQKDFSDKVDVFYRTRLEAGI